MDHTDSLCSIEMKFLEQNSKKWLIELVLAGILLKSPRRVHITNGEPLGVHPMHCRSDYQRRLTILYHRKYARKMNDEEDMCPWRIPRLMNDCEYTLPTASYDKFRRG